MHYGDYLLEVSGVRGESASAADHRDNELDGLAYEPERDIGDPDLPPPPDGGRAGHDDDDDDIIGPSITADDAGGYRWFHEYSGGSDTAASGGASDHAVADDLAYEPERDIGDPDLPPPPDGDASGEVREVNNQITSFIDGSSTYGSIDRGAVTDLSTEEGAGGDSVILVDIIGASAAANGGASDHAVVDDLAYEPERDIGDPDLPPPPDGGRTGEQGGGDIIGARTAANGGASDHAVADDLAYEPERDIGDPDLPPPPDGRRTGDDDGADSFVFAESTDNAAEYGDAGEQVYLAGELINPRSGETVDHIDPWVGGISELPTQESGGDTLVHEVGHWAAADLDCHFDENGELFCIDLL